MIIENLKVFGSFFRYPCLAFQKQVIEVINIDTCRRKVQ
jgi:hypothetical protein